MPEETVTSLGIGIEVSDDGKSAKLVIGGQEKSIKVPMPLEKLTEFISTLGQARADLAGASAPPEFQIGQNIVSVHGAAFYVQQEPNNERLLALYHPAFGPVGFVLSPVEAAKLSLLLTSLLEPDTGPPKVH